MQGFCKVPAVLPPFHLQTTEYLKYYIVPTILLTPALDQNQTTQTLLGDRHMLMFTSNSSQVQALALMGSCVHLFVKLASFMDLYQKKKIIRALRRLI